MEALVERDAMGTLRGAEGSLSFRPLLLPSSFLVSFQLFFSKGIKKDGKSSYTGEEMNENLHPPSLRDQGQPLSFTLFCSPMLGDLADRLETWPPNRADNCFGKNGIFQKQP